MTSTWTLAGALPELSGYRIREREEPLTRKGFGSDKRERDGENEEEDGGVCVYRKVGEEKRYFVAFDDIIISFQVERFWEDNPCY